MRFGMTIATLLESLKPNQPTPSISSEDPSMEAFHLWDTWDFEEDLWRDALLPELIRYLYGAKAINMPTGWKERIPRVL